MIWRLIRYLFPKRRLQTRLPLLPRRYSSDKNACGEPPAEAQREIRRLLVAGVAQTPADAYRLMCEHNIPASEIIRLEKRRRHPLNRWRRAWKRFKRIW